MLFSPVLCYLFALSTFLITLLYPGWSRRGNYRRCCSRRVGAQTSG